MATILEVGGVAPTIGHDVFLAPTAVLIGDVRVADRANVWFGAVLRGDISHIEIGEESFSVTLSFNNRQERLIVPIAAITSFADPAVA